MDICGSVQCSIFNGEQVLKPQDLTEADTDVSSMLKFNGHAETIQKILDVVKKTAYGVDFVLWGLENQAKIHYAMPLRHMVGDAFSYMKEYDEIAAVNKKTGISIHRMNSCQVLRRLTGYIR